MNNNLSSTSAEPSWPWWLRTGDKLVLSSVPPPLPPPHTAADDAHNTDKPSLALAPGEWRHQLPSNSCTNSPAVSLSWTDSVLRGSLFDSCRGQVSLPSRNCLNALESRLNVCRSTQLPLGNNSAISLLLTWAGNQLHEHSRQAAGGCGILMLSCRGSF